jgi:hypothetical protein
LSIMQIGVDRGLCKPSIPRSQMTRVTPSAETYARAASARDGQPELGPGTRVLIRGT